MHLVVAVYNLTFQIIGLLSSLLVGYNWIGAMHIFSCFGGTVMTMYNFKNDRHSRINTYCTCISFYP